MRFKGTKILVTGGAGFIGSHIVDSLVTKGARVTVYDNFSFGRKENLEKSLRKIDIIKGDILNYRSLEKAVKGVDFISHQAAQLEIFRALADPLDDLKTNTIGTLNVLKAAQKAKVKKIICASSACVYGQPRYTPQDENHPTNPNWAYGVSKLAAEKYCQIFTQDMGIPVVSLRYGIVYGPREWYRRVLTIFIKRVVQGKPPVIFGKGNQYRDFIYVNDVVKMHNLCLKNKKADGKIYNVGSGKKTTIKQLASLVIKASGKDLSPKTEQVKEGEFSKIIKDKKRNIADLKGMCLGVEEAKRELGWKPEVDLLKGIEMEMEWAEQNLSRWKKIFYTR